MRLFLLTNLPFNLFDGTGYFFFSGVTDFGDWAAVVRGRPAHWLWRGLLVAAGAEAYCWAVVAVGSGLVRYVGVPRNETHRLGKLTFLPNFTWVSLRASVRHESDGNPMALAVRVAGDGGRALRASLADVLHSEGSGIMLGR
ncbi:MAG: hypothetical protein DMG41_22795 [Acidobacteria bacterium]|nr:MAG: hypothetical protein AUH13_24290 [Acidobacteria bacterium 13_2_20CM_58_27]PYT69868.1 MAG: hypothetical protein DMG42_20635 [Acidobacteriota bacterium]PYT85618.1 MAG: hypothetical protein DMG41_22795 [Acidobacteriota bacterium]